LISNIALFIQYVIIVIQPRPYTHGYECSRSQGIWKLVFQGPSLCLATARLASSSIPSTIWPLNTFRLLNSWDNMSRRSIVSKCTVSSGTRVC
jgi:hypothetical protein